MTDEEAAKKTDLEEKKSIIKLPREEQFPWALLTGAYMLFAVGLMLIMQGVSNTEFTTQLVMFVSSVLVFGLGGYYLHSYHRWLVRKVK